MIVLSAHPEYSATLLCDHDVVDTALLTSRILSAAVRKIDGVDNVLMDSFREDHLYEGPVDKEWLDWTSSKLENYLWVYRYFTACCKEHEYRFDLPFMLDASIHFLDPPKKLMDVGENLPFALPHKNLIKNNVVSYSSTRSSETHRWTRRSKPF